MGKWKESLAIDLIEFVKSVVRRRLHEDEESCREVL